MKAYRLLAHKTLVIVNHSFLYDIDEDFTNKKSYIKRARELTNKLNKEYMVKYNYKDIFGYPKDIGWRYCHKCNSFYWEDEGCECK